MLPLIITLWLVGGLAFYAADGYFHFGLVENKGTSSEIDWTWVCAIFWPICIWIVFAQKLRRHAEIVRERRLEKQQEIRRLRIEEEAKTRQFRLEAERETEEFYQEIQHNKTAR
jgi:hypothetical protein